MQESAIAEVHGTVVLPCNDLDVAIEHYQAVGFVLRAIGPADDPTWAELTVSGLHILLDSNSQADAPRLRLSGIDPDSVPAGDGTAAFVELIEHGRDRLAPETVQTLAVEHESPNGWIGGRAGMLYRDLIPQRHGGAYIASHIHIPEGGPVPDYVHHHDVSHQLIFCHRGWVRVVYQDQGPPFVLEPGDCVLQPPGIRHRVLEASDDLFVAEITCPAVHRTYLDHDLELPNDGPDPERRFSGQSFVRHVGTTASWTVVRGSDFEEQVTAVAAATNSVAAVRLLRAGSDQQRSWSLRHDEDLLFLFMVSGSARLLDPDGTAVGLLEGSSVAVPAGLHFALGGAVSGTTLLELRSRRPRSTASP